MIWQPISTAPESVPILVFCPKAHRGNDSCEVAVVVRSDEGEVSFWTNGGTNGRDDFYFAPDEIPTHWLPLPPPPSEGESAPAEQQNYILSSCPNCGVNFPQKLPRKGKPLDPTPVYPASLDKAP
jgi:hypothetical protein